MENVKTVNERRLEQTIAKNLEEIGSFESVERFMRKCGPLSTRHQYSNAANLYL